MKIERIAARRPSGTVDQEARELLTLRSARDLKKILSTEKKRLLERKREATQQAKERYKEAKAEARVRQAAKRVQLLKKWNEERQAEREQIKKAYDDLRVAILFSYAEGAARTKALKKALDEQRLMMKQHKARAKSPAQLKRELLAKEHRSERVEDVRREVQAVAPELLAYFDQVWSKIKKSPRQSAAEAFFEYAEAHPEETILAAERKADRDVMALVKSGEGPWKQRADRVSSVICERAAKSAREQKLFKLKDREFAALQALGIDPGKLMNTCFNDNVKSRRVVKPKTTFPMVVKEAFAEGAEIRKLENHEGVEERKFALRAFRALRNAEEEGPEALAAQIRRSKAARKLLAQWQSTKPGRPKFAQVMTALEDQEEAPF